MGYLPPPPTAKGNYYRSVPGNRVGINVLCVCSPNLMCNAESGSFVSTRQPTPIVLVVSACFSADQAHFSVTTDKAFRLSAISKTPKDYSCIAKVEVKESMPVLTWAVFLQWLLSLSDCLAMLHSNMGHWSTHKSA